MKKMRKRIFCIVLAVVVFTTSLQLPVIESKASEEDWTYIKLNSGSTNSYVTYGEGQFVRVTQSGIVHISKNGYSWTKKGSISIQSSIKGLEHIGNYFFGYGEDGEVYLSEDGCSWSIITVGRGCVSKIIYAEGRYVANVGLKNVISGDDIEYIGFGTYESQNGIDWKMVESTINYKFLDMTYGNNRFVAVGDNGAIYTRKTGEYWQKQESGIYSTIENIEYGNGVFIATSEYGEEIISKDGVNWESGEYGYSGKLAYYNSKFYKLQLASIQERECNNSNLGQWEYTALENSCGEFTDIAFGNGMIVLGAQNGVAVLEDTNSPDIALSQLRVKQGNLSTDFQPEINSYTVTVSDELTEIDIMAMATEEQAVITIKKQNQSPQKILNGGFVLVELEDEETNLEVTVTSEDGLTEKTYYLTVLKSKQYNVTAEQAEWGFVVGTGYVEQGGEITLTAIAKEGFEFTCWKEDGKEISNENELTITDVQSDRVFCPFFSLMEDNQMSAPQKTIPVNMGDEIVLSANFEDENSQGNTCSWKLLNGTDSAVEQVWSSSNGYETHLFVGENEEENVLYVKAYDYFNPDVFCIIIVTISTEDMPEYQITVNSNNTEAGFVSGGGSITEYENMALTATPQEGYYFVEWQENGVTYSKTETIILSRVTEDRNFVAVFEKIQLESIQITRKPAKISYYVGEQFETKGMLVQATYNDGTKKYISNYEYTPKDALTTENDYISISYKDGDVVKIAVLSISVTEADDSEEDNNEEEPKEDDNEEDDSQEEPKEDDSEEDDSEETPKIDDNEEDSKEDDSEETPKVDDGEEDSKKDDIENTPQDDDTENKNDNIEKNPEENNGSQQEADGNNNQEPNSVVNQENQNSDNSTKVGNIVKVGNYKYKITKIYSNGTGQVSFIGLSKNLTIVKIPDSIKINGKKFKVISIANNALKNQKKLKKITIGSYVQSVGKKAFCGCNKLKSITFKTNYLKKVGTKAFYGISKEAVIYVPKKKYSKYKKLLKGKGQKSSVKIKKK